MSGYQPPQQPPNQPPQQPAGQSPYGAGAAGGEDPGKTMGIVGLILAFFCSPVGLILSVMAMLKSKKAGHTNILAIVGIVVGAIALIIGIIMGVSIGSVVAKCAELGPGVHKSGGTTLTCG